MDSPEDWQSFSAAVKARTGLDLAGYRAAQMRRRLMRVLRQADAADLDDYVRTLDREPDQLARLRGSIGNHVSEFFRSPDRFEYLGQVVLRQLLAERPVLRVWSAGCSYGAEAYSLAILLDQLTPGRRHFILATDVDGAALERASAGDGFSARDLRHISAAVRRRYFVPGKPAVRPELRARVSFRQHDLLSGQAPAGGFDLIVCRNVLMYFNDEAKSGVARLLYDALGMGGYLFTASGEALVELPPAGFRPAGVAFYRKDGGVNAGG